MKKFLALALAGVMTLGLLAGCGQTGSGSASGAAPAEKIVKIGVYEPTSGDSASGGKRKFWVCSTPTWRLPPSP